MAKDPAFLFYPGDWLTPNTYDRNFSYPKDSSGVYLLVNPNYDVIQRTSNYEILYIGSAKSLKKRFEKHEVLRMLRKQFGYIQFYFLEIENYKEVEKYLINKIQPIFNTQWR